MNKCYWCGHSKPTYAFNLCITCYRWFRRHLTIPVVYCDLCGKFIRNGRAGLCYKCQKNLEKISITEGRLQNLESNFESIKTVLNQYHTAEEARGGLQEFFKERQFKLLNVLIDRYYFHKTLQEIGSELGTSREYIRQCQNKAIDIIKKANDIVL